MLCNAGGLGEGDYGAMAEIVWVYRGGRRCLA